MYHKPLTGFTKHPLSLTTLAMNPLARIGSVFLEFLSAVGRVALFVWASVSGMLHRPYYSRMLIKQMVELGYYSLPVVGMTTLFTGAVLALQTYSGFSRFNAES
ncbi:MAG: hypothetical protein EBX37_16525, partial [Alphaproteobacteria bacterium]|nr:hypothetical protein [Alphaproteobacteria bacterium]